MYLQTEQFCKALLLAFKALSKTVLTFGGMIFEIREKLTDLSVFKAK